MTKIRAKARLIISCDVEMEEELIKKVQEIFNGRLSPQDVADKILYAFINPKLETLEESIDGSWDGVCDFKKRLENFSLHKLL